MDATLCAVPASPCSPSHWQPWASAAPPAGAVNADHGNQVVSADPAGFTPHVMNGVGQRDHPDRQQDHRRRHVHLGEPVRHLRQHRRRRDPQPDLRVRRDHRRHRPAFNPNLGGAANSLDTDGTFVYVGGAFGSVGGNTAIKRVVKLTAAGAVVGAFNAVPNKVVNEVVVRGSRLYVGGGFTSVRSSGVNTTRNRAGRARPDDRRRPRRR